MGQEGPNGKDVPDKKSQPRSVGTRLSNPHYDALRRNVSSDAPRPLNHRGAVEETFPRGELVIFFRMVFW